MAYDITNSGALKKISGACKAAAKRKFKVWPSAYASGWGAYAVLKLVDLASLAAVKRKRKSNGL